MELRLFINGPLRPLTLDEAGEIPFPVTSITIEMRSGALYDATFRGYSGDCTPGGEWYLEIYYMYGKGRRGHLPGKEYGKTWRVWPSKPTKKDREAPWG